MSQEQPQNLRLMSYEGVPKTYDQLLAMHPLRPIHNDVELEHATDEMIDLLAGHDLNADQADYLDVLSTLVEAYETTHDPLDDPAILVWMHCGPCLMSMAWVLRIWPACWGSIAVWERNC